MMVHKILYAGLGVVLAAGTVLSGKRTLPETDWKLYEEACVAGGNISALGFTDYDLKNYKVRFYDGTYDYVVYDGEVAREQPAIPAIVGTAQEVDGEVQVIVPVYENLKNLIDVMGNAEDAMQGEVSLQTGLYTKEDHIATVLHETFHAWQYTNGLEDVLDAWETELAATNTAFRNTAPEDMRNSVGESITEEVDQNAVCRRLFEEEIRLMRDAYFFSMDDEEFVAKAGEAAALLKKRQGLLSAEARFAERYYCSVEGTARYVEGCAYRAITDDVSWEARYLGPFTYTNGSGKYYIEGMWICLLLDRLMPGWQESHAVTDLYGLFFEAISCAGNH